MDTLTGKRGRKGLRLTMIVTLLTAFILFCSTQTALLATDNQTAVSNALNYLKTQQHADGGFGVSDSSFSDTAYVIMAIASAEQDPNGWKVEGNSPLDYLVTQAPTLADETKLKENTGRIAQLILSLVAAGKDPRDFTAVDWVERLKQAQDPATGQFGDFAFNHMWAMLALKAANAEIPQNALDWLKNNQEDNGSFAWDYKGSGSGGDTNDTALAIQALVAAGELPSSDTIREAIDFLHTQQNNDGGFPWVTPSWWGTDSDANSTSWVIQALRAAGEDPQGSTWTRDGNTPLSFLLSLQNPSGAFAYQKSWPDDNLMSTYQAIPALMDTTFPIFFPPSPSPLPNPPEIPPQNPSPSPPEAGSPTSSETSTENITPGPTAGQIFTLTTLAGESASPLLGESKLMEGKKVTEKEKLGQAKEGKETPSMLGGARKFVFLGLGFLLGTLTFTGIIVVAIKWGNLL